MTFDELFERATGHAPFPYQRALASGDSLPDLLEASTGAGKTAAVILAWLWRRRFAAAAVRRATPRRLVFCLPMRSLVTQTMQAASGWIAALGLVDRVPVHALLGGAVDNSFDGAPEVDAILIGTQDQLLSRALNRGYGVSRYRWPMHFALLNNDCLWVMDEVQLMGVGLSTSAQLAAYRSTFGTTGPTHALWMSATMDPRLLETVDHRGRELRCEGLGPGDQTHPTLARRLAAQKRLALQTGLPVADTATYARALADLAASSHVAGTRTLVVVNRVARAQGVYRHLARDGAEVALLHSRYRPADRRAIEARVLARTWTGILVATQAIEAGVDISSKALITELAPWSSLVQRFGRCNRSGEWPDDDPARILVIDLPRPSAARSEKEQKKAEQDYAAIAAPYAADDLDAARALVEQHEDAAPIGLDRGLPSDLEPAGPVIRRRDAVELFDTTPDLNGRDLDVSRYVRDRGLPDVQIAWRTWSDGEAPPADAPALQRDELCSVPLLSAAKHIKAARKTDRRSCYRWDALEGCWQAATDSLIPGVTYLLRARAGGYDVTLGWTGDKKSVPAAVPLRPIPQDADSADRLTVGSSQFVALEQHSAEARDFARELRTALSYELPWEDIVEATHWHDLGKTHPSFQAMLTSALPAEDPLRCGGPWAKSDGRAGGRRCERPHFRHELASALAMIEHGRTDLAAYLAMCHHGKVRLMIRSRPTERGPSDGQLFALGVHDGDVLPATSLGGGVTVGETTLRLDLMQLGMAERPSWTARTLALLDQWGPYRLALMETMVRVADWRASGLHATKEGLTHA